jgi:alpha-1,6-mannosyltransferase
MHLVDTTLFYSPTSGGVKRYLTAKHAWLRQHTTWQHSILVPGEEDLIERGGVCTVAGRRVPGTFNYRLPLNPRRWSELLAALEPDLIEAGDAFHPAWCAWRVAQRRGVSLVAFYHSNLPHIIGRRFGMLSERGVGRYVRWLYERFDLVLAPSQLMCDYLRNLGLQHVAHQPLGVDAEVFSPKRRTLDLRKQLNLPPETRLLAYAGRFSGEKNVPVLMQAFARLGRPQAIASRMTRPNVSCVPACTSASTEASHCASSTLSRR